MAKAAKSATLEKWEAALIKSMLARSGYNDQQILAYFTRPSRTINHRVISEVRKEAKHKLVKAATDDQLDEFLDSWPDVDPKTGLSVRGDELLVKAREAMIAAVHIFNGAGLIFRAELFIVTSIIAWTYLMHAWFRRANIDYRYKDAQGNIQKTKQGGDRYWELGYCLGHQRCPVDPGVVKNLEFLLELRHEIEHRSTDRIDEAISAKLQACCLNFNSAIKQHFGDQYGLERQLSIALQFATFGTEQRRQLKRQTNIPQNIEAMLDAFHKGLSEDELADPQFAYRVVFVPKSGNHAATADMVYEFVKSDSEEGKEINRILLKEVDRRRYTATQIVRQIQKEGFPKFTLRHHTELWRSLDAKSPAKGFGQVGDYKRTWVWRDSWLDRVRVHCQEQAERYK